MLEFLSPEIRQELSQLKLTELLAVLTGQPLQLRKDPDALVCRKQAAHHLSISIGYLRKLEAEGKGPKVVRMGARVLRYRIGDLDAWRDSHRQGGGDVRKR